MLLGLKDVETCSLLNKLLLLELKHPLQKRHDHSHLNSHSDLHYTNLIYVSSDKFVALAILWIEQLFLFPNNILI